MTGAESLQLFQQLVANANSLFLSDADLVTINGITKPTLKKIYAEFLASMGTYTTVAAGLAATSGSGTNNRFFSVPGTGDVFETRYRNDAGVAVEISSLLSWLADALTINKGKAYPLRQMNRGGVTSPANPVMNRFLLNCEVLGADLTKYYLISLQKNGASLGGSYEFGWILYEADPATYASTGAVTEIHSYTNPAPNIDRTGGVQTLIVTPNLRPDLRFKIVVDASALPASGTAIDSSSTGTNGRSWIIDPSRYSAPPVIRDDSLSINRGKVYPLRKMTRNGTTSAEPTAFSKAILNICIIGARPGKYYRLAYFVNGSTALPSAKPDGWIIEEIDQANYETAANVATQVISVADAGTPTIARDGIQTVVLASTVAIDLRILITLDTAQLPAYGTFIGAANTINPGYSYIIDPSRYIPAKSESTNSISLNAGQIVPFRNTSRGGSVSTPSPLQTNVILNARVINAKRGKYYGLRYFQNGNAAVVPAADGWIVEEVDIAGYDASVITTGNSISALADPQPAIDRTLGIQTLLINTKTDVRIELVLDASKLQAYGTQYGMNAIFQNGYSQVIDPACYEFPVTSGGTPSRVTYSVDSSMRLTLSWPDGVGTRGFVFGLNGANSLANFAQVILNGGVISSFATDWLPPMIFDAVNNGDGWPTLEFTGGNHLVDGKVTAASVAYVIEADGVTLVPGSSGTASRVTCRIINKLMAGNTVSLGRYPLLQAFQVDFMPGVAGVHAEIMALEDVDIYIDYACQIVTSGVNDTLFYLGGQFPTPIPFDGTVNSGAPSAYPDAWAVLTTSANGQLGAWIDRNYGVAAEEHIYEGYGKIIGGGSASSKQYTSAIHKFLQRDPANAMRLQAGKSYQWRGGYSWGPVSLPDGMVATLRYMDEWRIRRAFAVSANKVLKP
ncbi:hypothetical protein [Pseudomonas sp. p21]|uniref:hypothetical protein n=1 Tax=Pseudomonas sp. p21 TaxID=1825979 RepID=UPI0007C87795|nr:hypothetical protein [Pseudomonas sp. p21]